VIANAIVTTMKNHILKNISALNFIKKNIKAMAITNAIIIEKILLCGFKSWGGSNPNGKLCVVTFKGFPSLSNSCEIWGEYDEITAIPINWEIMNIAKSNKINFGGLFIFLYSN
jgi:hypothetical protein